MLETINNKISSLVTGLVSENLVFDGSFNGRLSILNRLKFTLDYGVTNQIVVETYSSGEDSFNFEDENEISRFGDEVSMHEVVEKLFDINTLMKVVSFSIKTRMIALIFQVGLGQVLSLATWTNTLNT